MSTPTSVSSTRGQTADVPPGRGDAISFVQSDAVAAVNGRRTSEVRAMAASPEIGPAQRIASQPTNGGGQLAVACRDHLGRRRAGPALRRHRRRPVGE
jgi:hypothetical protein